MFEFITNLSWIIISIIGFLAVVYSLVRLAAIAWHRTKQEYNEQHFRDGEFPNKDHKHSWLNPMDLNDEE